MIELLLVLLLPVAVVIAAARYLTAGKPHSPWHQLATLGDLEYEVVGPLARKLDAFLLDDGGGTMVGIDHLVAHFEPSDVLANLDYRSGPFVPEKIWIAKSRSYLRI